MSKRRRAGNENFKRRTELAAIQIELHHDFMLGIGDDKVGINPQATAEILNPGRRNQAVATAGDDQHWLPELCGNAGLANSAMARSAASALAIVGALSAKLVRPQ